MKLKIPNKAHLSKEITNTEINSAKVAFDAAKEAIVLLENNGILPLKPGKIALFGAGAGMTIKGGTGSGEVNERHAYSIAEGLEEAGFTVTTKDWIEEYERTYKKGLADYREEFMRTHKLTDIVNIMAEPFQYPFGRKITEAEIKASDTDTCIYVIARQAGEGADRKLDKLQYHISDEEKENIKLCSEEFNNLLIVINTGSTFDVSFVPEVAKDAAVVFYCQQGSQGGRAFADLILGKSDFSGRLTSTWAKDYYDYPCADEFSYLNGDLKDEFYKEGIYVGYRYFDTFKVEPKYPFGYGLSYTTFDIDTDSLTIEKTRVKARVKVTNTGDTFQGKEVVQLYVSPSQKDFTKEYQKLAAFAKTKELKPGESESLELSFDMADMASYDEAAAESLLSAGEYIVRIGHDSKDTKVAALIELDEKAVVSKHVNICKNKKTVNEMVNLKVDYEAIPEGVARLSLKAKDFETKVFTYEKPKRAAGDEIDKLINEIPVKDLARILAGPGYFGGKKWHEVPGAAGYTTGDLLKYGVPNVALCDGPAGLRIQRTSAVTKSGNVKMIDAQIDVLNYIKIPGIVKKFMYGDPNKDTLIYQFTTSFPVGQALAQTWNVELIKEVGRAVSAEMTEYGASYWLAPALNIQRNPLCGRNFEYYSEDPLISGRIAAAMSLGVQETKGNFVTVKHFCCNNQEDNRNHVNENLSERALREIYLKAFEIAVKEGEPGSVMSSYNLVNGTYVNNSYDLLIKVLRNEWGYEGFVMTDWFATGKGVGDTAGAIKAGNDLIEPGGGAAYKAIIKALKKGDLTKDEIKWCAANILKGVLATGVYKEFVSERSGS